MSKRHRHAKPCPTATKTAYSTEAFAAQALAWLRTVPPQELDGPRPVRAYRCTCGDWHLTSRAESYADTAARMEATPRLFEYEALPNQWRDIDSGNVVPAEAMPDAD